MGLLRSRRAWGALLLAIAAFVTMPFLGGGSASAHPLGNFTTNRYSRIELSPSGVGVHYVLDLAEIPAFQAKEDIDADANGDAGAAESDAYVRRMFEDIGANLELTIAGKAVDLRPGVSALTFPAGQGGLETLRLELDFSAPLPDGWQRAPQPVEFHDDNYGDRIGWREVVVRSVDGVAIRDSSVPATDVSNELRSYPESSISNPLDVTSATFSFEPGAGTTIAPSSPTSAAATDSTRSNSRFTALVTNDEITVPFLLGALALAFVFGMLHALGPGHGKTVVAAYLVGERGTARHALLLGGLVTATHTSSVFGLGLVTLYASQFIVPERLYPWLSLLSGVLVVALGGVLLLSRLRGFLAKRRARAVEAHDHAHPHSHTHDMPAALSWKSLVALGVSGGILPCPSALVVLLGAISLHRVGLGLLLVVAFSAGLAAVLTSIGLALVWSGKLLARWQAGLSPLSRRRLAFASRLTPALPAFSALAITAVGIVMMVRVLAGDSLSL